MEATGRQEGLGGVRDSYETVESAIRIFTRRIGRLSKAEMESVVDLLKDYHASGTDYDRREIIETIAELVFDRPLVIHQDLLDTHRSRPEQLEKWCMWIGRRVRDARTDKGLTQEQLAELTGLPQSHISRIECGKHSPSRFTIEKIARGVERPLEWFDRG